MKYLILFSMISMGCATTKIYEQTLDANNKVTNGVLKAAHAEDVDPYLKNYCGGPYQITGSKIKTETEGFIFRYYWGYKYVDFKCQN